MIHVFELTWTGKMHAPGNSATMQTIATAFPNESVRVHAEADHITELKRDSTLMAYSNVSFHSVPEFSLYRGKTQIVSVRRFAHEFVAIWKAVSAGARDGERNVTMLISATSTAIFSAIWVMRLRPSRRIAVQVGLHGNLNDIRGWRTRNPLLRRFDLLSALDAGYGERIRFLVLESSIKTELTRVHPTVVSRTDVLPLPINCNEAEAAVAVPLSPPIRFGYVGLATHAKGSDLFLGLAAVMKAKYGGRAEFHLVGSLMPDTDPHPYRFLDSPVSHDRLAREEFTRRLSELHYIVLPYRKGYYDLSASGALIDAVTWLKPIIATDAGFVGQMVRESGEIGFIGTNVDGLAGAVDAAMQLDQERYDRQRAVLATIRNKRSPAAVAAVYRRSTDTLYA